jgi:PRTRC genetic system protein B
MELVASTGGAATATLQRAILLYGDAHNHTVKFATVHDVDKKTAMIMPGAPLTSEALGDALSALADGVGDRRWRAIDTRVIASGPGLVAWWSPEQVRHVHFHESSGMASGPAMQPAMFWVAYRKDLHVYTLAKSERPTMDTTLCPSIHYNIFQGGKVCLGSSVMPSDLEPAQYEQMFFESRFTHPNGDVKWQTHFEGGMPALWRKLLAEGGKKAFPKKALLRSKLTVEQALDNACGGKERH